MMPISRWLRAALTVCLAVALLLPAGVASAAEPAFAKLFIEAEDMDFPRQSLDINIYRRTQAGSFEPGDTVRYTAQINRMAGESSLFVQPMKDGTWMSVDYLTDLNADGVYELIDGGESPVFDAMTAAGRLERWRSQENYALSSGQIYPLNASTLAARGEAALRSHSALLGRTDQGADAPVICLVTLRNPTASGEEEQICFYFRLFEHVIIPSDVAPESWYYSAVEYGLRHGLFAGTGEDAFSPNAVVTRAQLAQILWRIGGAQAAAGLHFTDIAPTDWYAAAAAWCAENGLISGLSDDIFAPNAALTREQMSLILYRYAQQGEPELVFATSLTRYSDHQSIAPWAREGMEWAVGYDLLSGYQNNTLAPAKPITRAELAAVLRVFLQNLTE